MELLCLSPEALDDIAGQILAHLNNEVRVLLLEGDLGAGKTSLITMICSRLGCDERVTSPTFSLINEYRADGKPIYHIDLYRLESIEEAIEIGIEEYLYSGNWCFIEWPALVKPIVELPYASVKIAIDSSTTRKIRILKYTTQPSS